MKNYAICINNEGNEFSLERMKVYQLSGAFEEKAGLIGIIDESGDDYLYPQENFIIIDVPELEEVLV